MTAPDSGSRAPELKCAACSHAIDSHATVEAPGFHCGADRYDDRCECRMTQQAILRDLLLSFIGSLTLCDHMGDVSNAVQVVLDRLGVKIEWDEWHDLGRALGKLGVRTLYGTELTSDDEESDA